MFSHFNRLQRDSPQALQSLEFGNPGEIIAMDLRVALDALAAIIGETTPDDVLDRIFKTFCIGK